MSEKRIDPPIPLPAFDPYEQLGKARDHIRELEAENERLHGCARRIEARAEAAEGKLAEVGGLPEKWRNTHSVWPPSNLPWKECADELAAALKEE